jgi:hypothetical protein
MNSRIPINTKFSGNVIRHPAMKSVIPIGTWWEFEQWRKGKLIDKWEKKNTTTTEGLNAFLDIMFGAATQIAAWYIGIFEDDYYTQLEDTYAIPGFTESSSYDEAARVAYVMAAADGGEISNVASKAVFTISAPQTIYGAFLCGGGTDPTLIGDVAGGGTLFAGSTFTTPKEVVDNDVLMVVCRITLSDYTP